VLEQREIVGILKAAAEPTRLRLLVLLAGGELNVKDLTRILGQSQPRISRHLKLLTEAGLIERIPDGSFAYFQIADRGAVGKLLEGILGSIDASDPALIRDRGRADAVKREREATAQRYFEAHAREWDRIRSLHVTESLVDEAVRHALGAGPFRLLVDLGTGTGRILELLAERYARGLGFDINHTMLDYARGRLDRLGLKQASVRHGDIYGVPLPSGEADAVVMHQVLHFLAEPSQAIEEAARLLAPGGRLVIVDFAPHALEFLRESFAHERLGFAHATIEQWLGDADLVPLATEHLAPSGGDGSDKLTVTLWTAERRHAASARTASGNAHRNQLEVSGS
jgi:ArsR family transcriptional regulator